MIYLQEILLFYAVICAAFGAINVLPAGKVPMKTQGVLASLALFFGIGCLIGGCILGYWLGLGLVILIYFGVTVLAGRITVALLKRKK